MITTHFYLDTRRPVRDGSYPLKFAIIRRGSAVYVPLNIRLTAEQWSQQRQRILHHPAKDSLNAYLAKVKLRSDDLLRELQLSGKAQELLLGDIKALVSEELFGTEQYVLFLDVYKSALAGLSPRTILGYGVFLHSIRGFDAEIETRPVRTITSDYIERYRTHLCDNGAAANTISEYLSKLHKVLNCAYKQGAINAVPEINTSRVPTRKRNLSQRQIQRLWQYAQENPNPALDFFFFSFLLIAANAADCALMKHSSVFNGRIDYDRCKTGKHYSVLLLPELDPILDRHSDEEYLFADFDKADPNSTTSTFNYHLAKAAAILGLPKISTYWARHTWASLAMELDIPIETVSAALGHSYGARVTMGYVNFAQKKVDDANRRVVDYALYGKK